MYFCVINNCRGEHFTVKNDKSISETNIFRPYFEKTSHDVTVQLGDSAFFECHIFNLHNQTVDIKNIQQSIFNRLRVSGKKYQLKVSGVLDSQIRWVPSLHRGWEIHQWQKIWTDFFQVCMRYMKIPCPGGRQGKRGTKALEWFDKIPRRDQALIEPRCQI